MSRDFMKEMVQLSGDTPTNEELEMFKEGRERMGLPVRG